MKKNIFNIYQNLSISLMTVLAITFLACNNSTTQTSSENDSLSAEDVAEEEVQENAIIGERAFFQAHGNVKTIEIVSGCQFYPNYDLPEVITFDENGIFLGSEAEKQKSSGDSLLIWSNYIEEFDTFGSTLVYIKGNLTEQYGLEWGAKFEYNDQGQIVKEETMGDCDEYTATYAYDKDGNCVERSDGSKTITYEILETDSHNNWLKRTSSEGDTDERTITYFE